MQHLTNIELMLIVLASCVLTSFCNSILIDGFKWSATRAAFVSIFSPILIPIGFVGVGFFVIGESFYKLMTVFARSGKVAGR